MSRKYWRVSSFDKELAARIAYETGYDELAVLLLTSRGITDSDKISSFMECDGGFSDPFLIKDMDKAVERIRSAVDNFEKIAVYGDYDADGVTATSLLYLYLATLGADVMYYIPSRLNEGYGLHNEAVDSLCEQGVKLIITVDNGINSIEEAKYIRSKGIDLVITDHHQPGNVLPEAVAVVNPHRADDSSPFKDYAGVGVAFKLAVAMEDGDCDSVLDDFADIIAIGTIADIVPLRGENRLIAIRGIEAINNSPRCGIEALRERLGYADKPCTSGNIAFGIAPKINAAGRIDTAETALKLLLTENSGEAEDISVKLERYNVVRQETEHGIVSEAVSIVEGNDDIKYSRVIVVDGEGWHSGIIGIVASKLVELYGKPAIVIARDGDNEAKGSCRGITGFSLFDALSDSGELLTHFGGHTLAAGFSINNENIEEFRKRINSYASGFPVFYPELNIDCRINPVSVNMDFVDSLSLLEPFGAENPQPLFGLYKVNLLGIRSLGASGKHIRLSLEKNGTQFSAVYFGMAEEDFQYVPGDEIDIAVTLDRNEFRGEVKAAIYIKAVKLFAFNDDLYFSSNFLYNKLRHGDELTENEKRLACPDRTLAASVFRYIKKSGKCSKSAEYIAVKLGYDSGKTCAVKTSLDAFCELGLMVYEDSQYSINQTTAKVSLGSSEILKKLGYHD